MKNMKEKESACKLINIILIYENLIASLLTWIIQNVIYALQKVCFLKVQGV